jgi:acetyltransferase
VHKSDVGGVRIDLSTPHAVREAAAALLDAARRIDPQATVVVQRMAAAGTEVVLGSTRDRTFGPLLMFGLGGVYVEVLKDVVFRVHPLSDVDASEMVRGIRSFPILAGMRGQVAADLGVLETTILRLDQLMADVPEIQEIDINPFFAGSLAADSAAADARVALTPVP